MYEVKIFYVGNYNWFDSFKHKIVLAFSRFITVFDIIYNFPLKSKFIFFPHIVYRLNSTIRNMKRGRICSIFSETHSHNLRGLVGKKNSLSLWNNIHDSFNTNVWNHAHRYCRKENIWERGFTYRVCKFSFSTHICAVENVLLNEQKNWS